MWDDVVVWGFLISFHLWLLERDTPEPPRWRSFRLCISPPWDFTGMGHPIQELKDQGLAEFGTWFQDKTISQPWCTPMPQFPH